MNKVPTYPEYFTYLHEIDIPAIPSQPDPHKSIYLERTEIVSSNVMNLPMLNPQDTMGTLANACSDLWDNGIDLATFQSLVDNHEYRAASKHYKQMLDMSISKKMLQNIKQTNPGP